ncbi:MAG: DedA family protein [Nitrospirae bacterium]|nr:DedA family protein [Nitrospirota bacterium]
MFHDFLGWLVEAVGTLGYPGVFIMMALESTFVPIPSEAVMIPAGYLVEQGKMDFFVSLIAGVSGSIAGSYLNYFLALWLGRPFILRYGKYVGVSKEKFLKVDKYFQNHGEITIFIGRLIPVVRHLISFPAGLGRMNHIKFTTYTSIGAGLWVAVLLGLGYMIGKNQQLINKYLTQVTILLVIASAVTVIAYVYLKKRYLKP